MSEAAVQWWVYVLASSDGARTYVGITLDVERRLRQHNGEIKGGARSTRAGRPWSVATRHGPFAGRGEASRHEASIKKLRGARRLAWCTP